MDGRGRLRVPEDCKKMLVLAGRNFCARFGRAGVLPMSVSASESCLFPVGRVRVAMEGAERKGREGGSVKSSSISSRRVSTRNSSRLVHSSARLDGSAVA